jgi:hypothetical protein
MTHTYVIVRLAYAQIKLKRKLVRKKISPKEN